MKLTDVIKQLNELYENQGDVDVCLYTGGQTFLVDSLKTKVFGENTDGENVVALFTY